MLSVDTKRKEWVGNFRNEGVTWRQGPLEVMETAFPSDAEGKAILYGLYDVGRNHGFVALYLTMQAFVIPGTGVLSVLSGALYN